MPGVRTWVALWTSFQPILPNLDYSPSWTTQNSPAQVMLDIEYEKCVLVRGVPTKSPWYSVLLMRPGVSPKSTAPMYIFYVLPKLPRWNKRLSFFI